MTTRSRRGPAKCRRHEPASRTAPERRETSSNARARFGSLTGPSAGAGTATPRPRPGPSPASSGRAARRLAAARARSAVPRRPSPRPQAQFGRCQCARRAPRARPAPRAATGRRRRRPRRAAACNAVQPSAAFLLGSAPAPKSRAQSAASPRKAAYASGRLRWPDGVSGSAPPSRRTSTHLLRPWTTATTKGVLPKPSRASSESPADTASRTASTSPARAARQSACGSFLAGRSGRLRSWWSGVTRRGACCCGSTSIIPALRVRRRRQIAMLFVRNACLPAPFLLPLEASRYLDASSSHVSRRVEALIFRRLRSQNRPKIRTDEGLRSSGHLTSLGKRASHGRARRGGRRNGGKNFSAFSLFS